MNRFALLVCILQFSLAIIILNCSNVYQLSVEKYLLPVENDISPTCKQIDIDTFCPRQALILLMLLFVDAFVLLAIFSCFFECQRAQKEGSSENDNGGFRVDKTELLKHIFSPIFIDIILV